MPDEVIGDIFERDGAALAPPLSPQAVGSI
jgi:hypothetical protein